MLAAFANALTLKVEYQSLATSFKIEPATGRADSGDFNTDLADILVSLGHVAHERNPAIVLYMDELQHIPIAQLASLVFAFHHVNQEQLPILLIAAGLLQLTHQTGEAKTYAERLFRLTASMTKMPRQP